LGKNQGPNIHSKFITKFVLDQLLDPPTTLSTTSIGGEAVLRKTQVPH